MTRYCFILKISKNQVHSENVNRGNHFKKPCKQCSKICHDSAWWVVTYSWVPATMCCIWGPTDEIWLVPEWKVYGIWWALSRDTKHPIAPWVQGSPILLELCQTNSPRVSQFLTLPSLLSIFILGSSLKPSGGKGRHC